MKTNTLRNVSQEIIEFPEFGMFIYPGDEIIIQDYKFYNSLVIEDLIINKFLVGYDRDNIELSPEDTMNIITGKPIKNNINTSNILSSIDNVWKEDGALREIPYNNCSSNLTTIALSSDAVYYVPFMVNRTRSISALAINATKTSSNTSCHLGIYDGVLDTTLHKYEPLNLLAEVTPINITSVGSYSGTLDNTITLNPNQLYFAAFTFSKNITLRGVPLTNLKNYLGLPNSSSVFDTMLRSNTMIGSFYNPIPSIGFTVLTTIVPAIFI